MKYEVEVKSLLQTEEKAQRLREELAKRGIKPVNRYKQLNHYFVNTGDFRQLLEKVKNLFSADKLKQLKKILTLGKKHSLRTREMNGEVFLVVKASVDDTTSANGILRMEFEEKVSLSLEELDKLLLAAGFDYQAKWSREREEYKKDDFYITIDKNAGYGYLAELEVTVNRKEDLVAARKKVREFMEELGLEELPQDRLERMFAFYNKNWRDYYGTKKIFNIK